MKNRSGIWTFTIVLITVICMNGCKNESSEKNIHEFRFEASKNPGLFHDVVAEIRDNDKIIANLSGEIDVKSLIATFYYSGKQVTVNNREQVSGISRNDFRSPVEYVVIAEDNSVRRYMVTVMITDNAITQFEFRKGINSGLLSDIKATIRNDSIIAETTANINVTSLIASFTSSAASVTVNGIRQSSGISRNDFSSPLKYVVEDFDGNKRTYTVDVKANASFTKFWIKRSLNPALAQDIVFDIDYDKLTIEAAYLRWINSENPSRMIVSFEAPGATVIIEGVPIQNGEAVVNFKQPIQFVTICGKNAPRIYSVNLICPQMNPSLPILRIEADGPIQNKVDDVPAKLEIIGNGITQGLWDFNKEKIGIRLRGNSTMWLPKKPYRIKFPEKYSPLGLNHAREKSWVLLANDCDKSLIRNAVANQINKIMQNDASYRRFTPCNQFVDVYLNGSYDGNYHLTDQVQVAPGRVNVQTLTASDTGDASKISGGYLLELDGFADPEPLWFASPRGMKITIKYPDSDDYAPEQATWIKNYITSFESALFSQEFKNPSTGWRKYINMASWVDHVISNELAGNSDAWWQVFMSKERDVDYFVMGPVWDFDIAFNNDNRIPNATYRLMAEAAHDPRLWINRFMQDETFKAAIKARWNAKKGELYSVIAYIDEMALLLDKSQKANFKRWNIRQQTLGHAMPAPVSYQAAIAELKNYLQARYNYLDTEFNKW